MGLQKVQRQKHEFAITDAAAGHDRLTLREGIERLHPSLRESFVALPDAGTALTPEQLQAVFGGDPSALRDITKLVFQPGEIKQNINR